MGCELDTRVRGKDGAIDIETKGTDHVTRLRGARQELLLEVSGRGVECVVLQEVTTVKAETIGLSGGVRHTRKTLVLGKTDKEPANSRTRDALCPSDIGRGEAGKALTLESS